MYSRGDAVRARRRTPEPGADQGSILTITLFFILLGSLLVLPILDRAILAYKTGQSAHRDSQREEAVKGAVRIVLADGAAVYKACSNASLTGAVPLNTEGMTVTSTTVCYRLKDTQQMADADLRVALTTTLAGSTVPVGAVGASFPASPDPAAWIASTSNLSQPNQIFLPNLPAREKKLRTGTPYTVPGTSCKVFFPGTYKDAVTVNWAEPTYFASGTYYFENTLTFSGEANVVVGRGSAEGCTDDQTAAWEIADIGKDHAVTGNGATFVFGGAGRMVITDSGSGTTGPSVIFNNRLVRDDEVGAIPGRHVNILTVNGVQSGPGASVDLDVPGMIRVPSSKLLDTSVAPPTPTVDASTQGYVPSTHLAMVPGPVPTPGTTPIIDVNLTTSNSSKLYIPGYVAVPQGTINISATSGAGSSVELLGGTLSANFSQSPVQPAALSVGIVNRVVQKTFKIVSTATVGGKTATAVAIVFVNDYGEYAVKSFYLV
jgi:hypothetical protein